MRANELDWIGGRVVVLVVARRDEVERDAQLLEDRAPLRRRRGEQQRRERSRAQLRTRFTMTVRRPASAVRRLKASL